MIRKIGINSGCWGRLELDEEFTLMKKNGFEAFFTGSENGRLEGYMEKAKEYGIACDNYHAPFDKINDIWKEGEIGDNMLGRLIDCVDKCAKYGVPSMVVHLSSGTKPPRINDLGLDRFEKLMNAADEKGVTVCYENQRMLGNIGQAFEIFPTAKFCWDTGHEQCFTSGRRYMDLFGKLLNQLHIHDNHAVFDGDEHMIPGDAVLDIGRVASSIAKTGFDGTIMLEVIRRNSHYYDDYSAEDYYSHAAEAAVRIRDAVDRMDRFLF